jgi:hypothetical protein
MGNIDYENFHLQKRLLNVKPTVPSAIPIKKTNRPYKLTVSDLNKSYDCCDIVRKTKGIQSERIRKQCNLDNRA